MRIAHLIPLCSLAVLACEASTPVDVDLEPQLAVSGVTQSVSGSWTIGGSRTFAFHATRQADGSVSGRWERVNSPGLRRENGTVVCFAIEGNQVWVGTHTTSGPSAGTDGWLRAIDNGEGPGAPPDLLSLQAAGRPLGSAAAYCNARPETPALMEVGSGQVQIREQDLPDTPGNESVLLATIEWPFNVLQPDHLPPEARMVLYYNGFYNPAPCTNAETRLMDVVVPWNTPGVVHRYDATTDASFLGFVGCMTDGTDQTLGMGIENVSGWAVEESMALDFGAPDLVGHTIDYIELVVDQLEAQPTAAGSIVTAVMRWRLFGS